MERVQRVILVLSGKGGVGKSTVSTQLALTLQHQGFKVGLLDVDLCGPSVPYLLQIEDRDVHQLPEGWVPVFTTQDESLAVMSIGLIGARDQAVIWRGPKKTAIIKQFFEKVLWGERDVLLVDTPPGTSDEHITLAECLRGIRCDGAVIVTSPQQVATEDVRKEISFCHKMKIPILGIIENLSGFVCPNCSECTNIFSSGGGQALAEHARLPFLGVLPIDPRVGELLGKPCVAELPTSTSAEVFDRICKGLSTTLNLVK